LTIPPVLTKVFSPMSDTISHPIDRVAGKVVQQKKLFILVTAVALAVVGAATLYQSKKGEVQSAAADALFKAKALLKEELQAETAKLTANAPKKTTTSGKGAEKASPSEPAALPEKFALSSVLAKSISELKSVSEKFDRSVAGYEANLILGQLYLEKDSAADASANAALYFGKAANQKLDSERTAVALSQLAYALESQGKKDDALVQIDSALSLSAKVGIEGDLLRQKVRLLQEKGDKAKALEAANQLLKNFPNSELSSWAESRKAELSQ
jgi:tetratricopeptide (TPR) repeat protein